MKKLVLTPLLVCLLISVFGNNVTDRKARCKAILAPFSEEQSLADRVTDDLLTGVWRSDIENGYQFIRFDLNGWSEVLEDVNHITNLKTFKWSVFEIGDLVYLRMDGGTRDNDHLYIIRQNCDGLILDHTSKDQDINLEFVSSKDEDEAKLIEANLVGDWIDPVDHTMLSLSLLENGEFIYMNQQLIQTGKWEVFKEGPYLLLHKEESCSPWVVPIKHIDFNHLDLVMPHPIDSFRSDIVSMEKKNIF